MGFLWGQVVHKNLYPYCWWYTHTWWFELPTNRLGYKYEYYNPDTCIVWDTTHETIPYDYLCIYKLYLYELQPWSFLNGISGWGQDIRPFGMHVKSHRVNIEPHGPGTWGIPVCHVYMSMPFYAYVKKNMHQNNDHKFVHICTCYNIYYIYIDVCIYYRYTDKS